jgi:hypothetical protein
MEISKKHARDFTVSFIHGTANTVTEYLNSGERQEIQWVYLLAGNVKIEYIMNGYAGSYDLFVEFLADLRPIRGLTTNWIGGTEDFYAVTFAASDESMYEADILTVTEEKKLDSSDQEKIIIPLISGVTINDIPISQLSAARIPANQSIKINVEHPGSPIFVFEKNV